MGVPSREWVGKRARRENAGYDSISGEAGDGQLTLGNALFFALLGPHADPLSGRRIVANREDIPIFRILSIIPIETEGNWSMTPLKPNFPQVRARPRVRKLFGEKRKG